MRSAGVQSPTDQRFHRPEASRAANLGQQPIETIGRFGDLLENEHRIMEIRFPPGSDERRDDRQVAPDRPPDDPPVAQHRPRRDPEQLPTDQPPVEEIPEPRLVGGARQPGRRHRPVHLHHRRRQGVEQRRDIGEADKADLVGDEPLPGQPIHQPRHPEAAAGRDEGPDAAVEELLQPGQAVVVRAGEIALPREEVRSRFERMTPGAEDIEPFGQLLRIRRARKGNHPDRLTAFKRAPDAHPPNNNPFQQF